VTEDLLDVDLPSLMARAREKRDCAFGSVVTYSPKVFIPLTRLCRDSCGYCTFVEPPARVDAPYMTIDEVVRLAAVGQASGCSEALFTLGERPELRYSIAGEWLHHRGFRSTVDYLAEACGAVLEQTGLLPHANAGALSADEFAILRPVTASQGMMLETLNADLAAHRLAPDKTPSRRLSALEAAGRTAVPFTTGILVGIGESPFDWIHAIQAISASHERFGHISEVIVQNFVPKPDIAMRNWGAPPSEVHLRAISIARLLLPDDVHVQAPPNLSSDFGTLLDAGIDDWGGISPVTPDHVNPHQPWPHVDSLRTVTGERGFELRARLPVHTGHISEQWLDPRVYGSLIRTYGDNRARLSAS
jgi:FO synthase